MRIFCDKILGLGKIVQVYIHKFLFVYFIRRYIDFSKEKKNNKALNSPLIKIPLKKLVINKSTSGKKNSNFLIVNFNLTIICTFFYFKATKTVRLP